MIHQNPRRPARAFPVSSLLAELTGGGDQVGYQPPTRATNLEPDALYYATIARKCASRQPYNSTNMVLEMLSPMFEHKCPRRFPLIRFFATAQLKVGAQALF